jgi:hypothetical protein
MTPDELREMMEMGEEITKNNFAEKVMANKANGLSYGDLPVERKMELCTHQGGFTSISKQLNGDVRRKPRYCSFCPKCLEMQARALEKKAEKAEEIARESKPDGRWYKKLVPKKSTEGKSHKKYIERNHDKCHMEFESTTHPDMDEIWCFTDEDDGKIGKPANLDEVDWDAVNKQDKKSRRKVSFGGGCRLSSPPSNSNKNKRIYLPEIIVSDKDEDRAVRIVIRTNLLKKVENFKQIQNLVIEQALLEIEALKQKNITVYAVSGQWLNVNEEQSVRDWNVHVDFWQKIEVAHQEQNGVSINDTNPKKEVVSKTDTAQHLDADQLAFLAAQDAYYDEQLAIMNG